ncbi:potassium/proton antiporter [Clostridium botulinum]|uniref:potassium/proton antiporter n=1 Tax=Clostridium botulinum TaxID=1491 RepID=UPI0007E203F0|nr:potassium/proton antiporter [Clostridium botulinum]KEI98093.1 potassium transporter [Clostridium botulinum F 357]MBE1302822.1 potassium/proton antiporter [Clostridium botulinum]
MDILLISGVILFLCVISSKVLYKYGVPTLIIFLAMGMIMGSEGLGGIYFDNSQLAGKLCNFGLLFIMFSGGFETNWKTARPVAFASTVLATIGVALTALLVGIFAHYFLGMTFLEGMLLGSIISSTDAASVFSILRSKNLNLKNSLAPMLEMESGSNDPMAYMLTTIFLGLITGNEQNIVMLITTQVLIGVLVGFLVGKVSLWLINNINLDIEGLYSVLAISVALLSYSIASAIMGNGFLAVYITGLVMGNSKLVQKVSLVRYFDGISWLMQILLFFTLGLLVFPSQLLKVALSGTATAAFIIFIARPIAVFLVLTLFKKPTKDKLLVSWVGFRGVASIVFATYPLIAGLSVADEIFNIVFFVALVSVLVQGTLFIPIAKKLDLVGEEETVLKTFNDYEEFAAELLEVNIDKNSKIVGKSIEDMNIPRDILIIMVRRGEKIITPNGATVIKADDTIVFSAEDKNKLLKINEKLKLA